MDHPPAELWQNVLSLLEKELNPAAYGMISSQLALQSVSTDTLQISVPNDFTLRNVKGKYFGALQKAVSEVCGEKVQVQLAIVKAQQSMAATAAAAKPAPRVEVPQDRPVMPTNLNPRYTFDNFVVGSHNKFPHATAQRVGESPGQAYNPLFIYGGVGLGKTHLMHAIGHRIMESRKDLRILYISSERFTNELINSFRDGTTLKFKERYRSVDLLLIDDIQFIGGKESTQEEFFHTFNELHDAGKQIVITSDRPPNEISTLENRLRSRFQMGLICDIQPPDFETRIAILKKKADMDGLHIPDDVHHYIARVYQSNVRELEGALIKLMAYTSMTGTHPTVSMAQSVLGPVPEREVNADLIQEVTAKHFNKKIEDLKGSSREKTINQARQVAIYLCRELTELSFPKIAEQFGGRDHSTIMHAYERIKTRRKAEFELDQAVQELVEKLR